MSKNEFKTVYRAIYKSELTSYLDTSNLKKDVYSLKNCQESYNGKNNIDYQKIAESFPSEENIYFIHFFDSFKCAKQYEKALKNNSFLKEDTTIIACQFPTSLLTTCQGFGIYEQYEAIPTKDSPTEPSKVFKEYAIPLSEFSSENVLGEAKSETDITQISITREVNNQVFYDPDDYS